jgi:hypothetical protein
VSKHVEVVKDYTDMFVICAFGFINEYLKQHTSNGLTDTRLFIYLPIYLFMVSLTVPNTKKFLRGMAEQFAKSNAKTVAASDVRCYPTCFEGVGEKKT